ncbi:MAG: TetR/AcrR family transcriptional regulator [Dehalococcoidia bacterium]
MTRSRQKQYRKDAILDAAEELVRELHETSFSMVALAEKAGVSPATPYNLFGSKASVLYTLLSRSLDGIFAGAAGLDLESDPFQQVLNAADAAGRFFASDPKYYRPLYQYLLGVIDPVHRPAYMDRALEYWRRALQAMRDAGFLTERERDAMALGIVIHIVGALDLWVHGDFDSDEFRAHVTRGVLLLLLHVADERSSAQLMRKLREVSASLPAGYSFNRTPRKKRAQAPSVGKKKSETKV